MDALTLFEIIPILLEIKKIINDKVVGFDEKIRRKFVEALKKALKQTVKDDDRYINNAVRQIDDLISLIIMVMDEPPLINTMQLPNYITREEFREFYDQTNKDEELHAVLGVKLQQCQNKRLFTELRSINQRFDNLAESSKELKASVEEIKVDIKELGGQHQCNLEAGKKFPDVLTDPPYMADTINVIGREKDLERLWELLSEKKHVMLTGMGGIGKTQLARQLFHNYKGEFVEVAWIEYRGNFKDSVLEGINTVRFKDDKDKYSSREERWQDIICTLKNDKKKKLFIIDNVENGTNQHPEQDIDLLKLTGWEETYVLLTSRSEVQLNHLYAQFAVDFLDLEKCIELFKYYHESKDFERETIVKIVDLAYKHTMTIELLAKGVSEGEDLETYYQRIKDGFESVDRKITVIHNRNVEATIEEQLKILYSMQVLEEKDRKILNCFAILPVNCDCKLKDIERWFGFESSDLDNVRKTGWLSYDKERKTFLIQPTVREIVRFDFKKDGQNKKSIAPKGTSDRIVEYFKSQPYRFTIENGRNFGYVVWMIEIARSVMATVAQEKNDCIAALYYNIGVGYNELGEYEEALFHFDKAKKIREKTLKAMQTNMANTYNNIGLVHLLQNEYDLALKYYYDALAIWRKNFKVTNLTIAESYSRLGGAFRKKGGEFDLIKALKYHEWALEIRTRYGKESLNVAVSYNNIGTVYLAQKKYNEAEAFINKALAIVELYDNNSAKKKEKKKGRIIAEIFYNSGELYLCQKKKGEALEYYKKAYQKLLEDFGENHPETKKVKNKIQELN